MPLPEDLALPLYPLRFHLRAQAPVAFPQASAGNVIRGALGLALRRLACVAGCPGFTGAPTVQCPAASDCLYAQLFEPAARIPRPSGFQEQPRAFVLRAAHLDGQRFCAGEPFYVDCHVFLCGLAAMEAISLLPQAFSSLRSDITLETVTRIDAPESPLLTAPLRLPLAASGPRCSRIQIDFLTPTELKSGGRVVSRPDFAVLFQRVRDRIATLRACYGSGPPDIDFRGMAARAAQIELEMCELAWIAAARRSSRTGQTHGLGGFTGTAHYAGELSEFLPWLCAAEWTGVGRQTVWGKGFFRVRTFPAVAD